MVNTLYDPLHCSWHQATLTVLKGRKVLFLSFPLCFFTENGVRNNSLWHRTLNKTTTNKIYNETQISKGIWMSRCTKSLIVITKNYGLACFDIYEKPVWIFYFCRHSPEEAECLFQHMLWGKQWVLYEAWEHEVFVGFTWTICQCVSV